MRERWISVSAMVTGLALALGASAAPAAEEVSKVIEDCESCHGDGGASEHEEIPVIGGMSAFYLEEQLLAYQEERRPCSEVEYPAGPEEGEKTDMCDEVKDLTEEQIKEIASHFADEPFVVPEQEHDPELAKKGEDVHNAKCRKCHTEGGGLAFDDAGILAGQWRPYLEQTFEEYRNGERWQPEKMKPKLEELSDADVEALIEYYVSQEPVE